MAQETYSQTSHTMELNAQCLRQFLANSGDGNGGSEEGSEENPNPPIKPYRGVPKKKKEKKPQECD